MKNKKVFVGLSGGVDSSVSAYLLKKSGFDVTGVFIKGWQPDWIPCTWMSDRISAMRTAAYLDIPFITLDLEMQYKNKVVSYLLEEYAKGHTPNPDMLCNREIKFGSFLNWSLKNGADYVATGHYAQNYKNQLLESIDKEKDQSYFLSQLTQKELQHILFPVGHLVKAEVRGIAAQAKLPVATRKDSQGICFVGDLSMKEFLKRELKPEKGNVENVDGEIIGEHDGAILYTIGERHGFTIINNTENQKQFYVVKKDVEKNVIVVSDSPLTPLLQRGEENKKEKFIYLNDFSFTQNIDEVQNSKNLSIRIRYRGAKVAVKFISYNVSENIVVVETEDNLVFDFGQFGVLYDRERCLGGGVISTNVVE